jgi:hypothetical protein
VNPISIPPGCGKDWESKGDSSLRFTLAQYILTVKEKDWCDQDEV